MSPESTQAEQSRPQYRKWLRGTLIFLALIIIARFVMEISGVPETRTRVLSSSAVVLLAAIYLGAVAPLRGVRKSLQLIVPGILLAVWTQAWVILATVVSAVLRLERSHFAEREDYGNWAHLWGHILGHLKDLVPFSLVALVLMATVLVLWRWPVTVGPGAILGALVMMRYSAEAMGADPARAAAWSSTVGILLCGFYLGGVAPRLGQETLLAPALIIGWVWRFWIFLATVMSAAFPYYKTHFFDPSEGHVAMRLVRYFGGEVLLVGILAGLVVWVIAVWIRHATPAAAA